LKLQGKLAINTRRGKDVYALLKMKPRPALNGLSIGYVAKDFELHRTGPIKRTLKKIDLKEISLVTFPADRFSRVSGVKAGFEDDIDEETLAKNNAAALARWMENEWAAMRRLISSVPR